jgi:deoxyribodipyrimidine photo-lyase
MREERAMRSKSVDVRDAAPVVVWFTRDLRLADHPALLGAVATRRPIIACYVLDEQGRAAPGAASRWWLHGSLAALHGALKRRGGGLVLWRGVPQEALVALAKRVGAAEVVCSRRYEPEAAAAERDVAAALHAIGVGFTACGGRLLLEPEALRNRAGEPFKVFMPFWRACSAAVTTGASRPAPRAIRFYRPLPKGDRLEEWRLRPTAPDWAGGFDALWKPGEEGAIERFGAFLEAGLADYQELRDRLDAGATSGLSAHLHFGEISPGQVWSAVHAYAAQHGRAARGAAAFLRELLWREFSYHLLAQRPDLPEQPFRPAFARFPWRDDESAYGAWQRGATGYPLVDAGMRELWLTGWMHNRARMVVASFLTKHLLIPWQRGAAWFWDTLVDADLANNSVSWQWVAGSGADAAPYFRVFNPVLQGKKFDPSGAYVKRWVPELAALPAHVIHAPWHARAASLRAARVELGRDYPLPIVEHELARRRALGAHARMRALAAR